MQHHKYRWKTFTIRKKRSELAELAGLQRAGNFSDALQTIFPPQQNSNWVLSIPVLIPAYWSAFWPHSCDLLMSWWNHETSSRPAIWVSEQVDQYLVGRSTRVNNGWVMCSVYLLSHLMPVVSSKTALMDRLVFIRMVPPLLHNKLFSSTERKTADQNMQQMARDWVKMGNTDTYTYNADH